MKSLESSGDSVFKMLMYTMMIGAVVALYITPSRLHHQGPR